MEVQFAISRTVVYGVVSTIVLVFLAVLHWLLGRMIEHSGFALGLEGLAAVGLGLVLHRASHGINTTVDRVLFRKHHAAEERLRQVTAALPFAGTEQSIAQAILVEPTCHSFKRECGSRGQGGSSFSGQSNLLGQDRNPASSRPDGCVWPWQGLDVPR